MGCAGCGSWPPSGVTLASTLAKQLMSMALGSVRPAWRSEVSTSHSPWTPSLAPALFPPNCLRSHNLSSGMPELKGPQRAPSLATYIVVESAEVQRGEVTCPDHRASCSVLSLPRSTAFPVLSHAGPWCSQRPCFLPLATLSLHSSKPLSPCPSWSPPSHPPASLLLLISLLCRISCGWGWQWGNV